VILLHWAGVNPETGDAVRSTDEVSAALYGKARTVVWTRKMIRISVIMFVCFANSFIGPRQASKTEAVDWRIARGIGSVNRGDIRADDCKRQMNYCP